MHGSLVIGTPEAPKKGPPKTSTPPRFTGEIRGTEERAALPSAVYILIMMQDDPLRAAAEQRAADIEAERVAAARSANAHRQRQQERDDARKAAISDLDSSAGNESAQFAKVAASDYNHNSTRAMIGPDGQPFLEPRWQPDEETENCSKCSRQFDFFWHRKHHCRHCGFIFCDSCSSNRALLPVAFNLTDPQRVCVACFTTLQPHQEQLAELIANAEKSNAVDMTEGSLMRYCNLPFSLTLGSEIRKAAYRCVVLWVLCL